VRPDVAAAESRSGARARLAEERLREAFPPAPAPAPKRVRAARETALDKARRGIGEGRLIIIEVSPTAVTARWRGSGEVHRVGYDAGIGWWCSCPNGVARARGRGSCSHLHAVKLVVAVRPGEGDHR
jgi:hypothetical protein